MRAVAPVISQPPVRGMHRPDEGAIRWDLPLVVCIGSSKAGTTTLFELLRQHPEVAASSTKETNFFFDDDLYRRGFDWFRRTHFRPERHSKILFDADPAYQVHPHVFERIRNCAPDARIILIVRNPVDRAFSQYLYRAQLGRTKETFEDVCREEPARIAAGGNARNEHGYLERSRYGRYIAKLLNCFPRDRVHFIKFESFIADQMQTMAVLQSWLQLAPFNFEPVHENPTGRPRSLILARILYDARLRGLRRAMGAPLEMLGLKTSAVATVQRLNEVPYPPDEKPRLAASTRRRLLEEFMDDIALTERLTGLDLEDWKRSKAEGEPRLAASAAP